MSVQFDLQSRSQPLAWTKRDRELPLLHAQDETWLTAQATQTVSLSLHRFDGAGGKVWALSQMLLARRALARTRGLSFWKLVGSGIGEGFTPVPNISVYGILAVWCDADTATDTVQTAPVYRRYRAHASESWSVFLSPTSVRGRWSGVRPFEPAHDTGVGPIAALTRATIRPSKLIRFWRRGPEISRRIGEDPNVIMKIGIGEVPWLHQVTFSIWPDAESMAAFARREGPHAAAIRAVREGGWFSEELYARFRVMGERGTWGGSKVLDKSRV
jgi:spheroidene monooxygenase